MKTDEEIMEEVLKEHKIGRQTLGHQAVKEALSIQRKDILEMIEKMQRDYKGLMGCVIGYVGVRDMIDELKKQIEELKRSFCSVNRY